MKAIDYAVADTVADAVSLLSEPGVIARPLAGGTDILVQLRVGRRQVDRLVDVKKIPDLNALNYDPNNGLEIGAATACYRIYQNEEISLAFPGLIDAASLIGGIQIQGRASIGGNLCNAAPSADGIPPLIVLGAIASIAGPQGNRTIPVEEFCTGPGQTTLTSGEFLVSLHLPQPQPNSGAHYLRFIPRNEMDIAVVGSAASITLDANKTHIVSIRVALASVAPKPIFVQGLNNALIGKEVNAATIQTAADLATEAATPISDMRGTKEYRKHLVEVLTKRALTGAIRRAKGEG